MAFTQDTFAPLSTRSSTAPAFWSYTTTDILDVVLAAGYFSDKQFQLENGDLIYVNAPDSDQILKYTDQSTDQTQLTSAIRQVREQTSNITIESSGAGAVNVWDIAGIPSVFLPDGLPIGFAFSVMNIGAGGSVIILPTGSDTILGTDAVSDPTKQLILLKITPTVWQGAEI